MTFYLTGGGIKAAATKQKQIMEKKILDIAIDIETLSRKPTAAIIAIAARPFYLDGWGEEEEPSGEPFSKTVDASSCAMYGMDFENGTIQFWSQQSKKAKSQFTYGYAASINIVLESLKETIEEWKEFHKATGLRVWMQGTDFDGAILKNAYITVFNDDKSVGENESMPWRHDELRDSRTFILEHMRRFHPKAEAPYSIIPPLEGLTKHVADDDVKQLIHNVQFCWYEQNEAYNTFLKYRELEAQKNEPDNLKNESE